MAKAFRILLNEGLNAKYANYMLLQDTTKQHHENFWNKS